MTSYCDRVLDRSTRRAARQCVFLCSKFFVCQAKCCCQERVFVCSACSDVITCVCGVAAVVSGLECVRATEKAGELELASLVCQTSAKSTFQLSNKVLFQILLSASAEKLILSLDYYTYLQSFPCDCHFLCNCHLRIILLFSKD